MKVALENWENCLDFTSQGKLENFLVTEIRVISENFASGFMGTLFYTNVILYHI